MLASDGGHTVQMSAHRPAVSVENVGTMRTLPHERSTWSHVVRGRRPRQQYDLVHSRSSRRAATAAALACWRACRGDVRVLSRSQSEAPQQRPHLGPPSPGTLARVASAGGGGDEAPASIALPEAVTVHQVRTRAAPPRRPGPGKVVVLPETAEP